MRRPSTKYLTSYPDSLENLRAQIAQDPAKLILAKKKNGDGFFKIPKDETGELVNFDFRYPQRQAYEIYQEEKRSGRPIRLWFLKARRVGLTSLFAALETVNSWSMDNRRVGIIAHNDDRSKRILQMCKGYYKRLPAFMQLPLSKDATAGIKYAQHDSELVIGVCRQPEKVRGDGLHEGHLSEAAFFGSYFEKVLTEISTTIAPAAGTSIIIESTGRARGSAAHSHWQEAREGKNVYRAHFLPWVEDPECTLPFPDDRYRDMILKNLADVEPRLLEKLNYWRRKQEVEKGLFLTSEQYHWAYWTYLHRCNQNFSYFCRDFPFDEEEAWTAEGDSFFGENEIQKAKPDDNCHWFGFKGKFINQTFNKFTELERIDKVRDFESTPHIKLWNMPAEHREYIIAADCSWGGARSTFTAGYIIDKETREMMCAYHGRIRPDEHAVIMASLGNIYNNAVLAPEINAGGGGMQILTDLQRLGYYNIYTWRKRDRPSGLEYQNAVGWVTNVNTRPLALGELHRMFTDCMHERFTDTGMFKDRALITEMRSFHVDPDTGRPEAFADSFDDRILALGIAHRVAGDEAIAGGMDRWMVYDPKEKTHPLTKMAEAMIDREESEDAAQAVQMLTHRGFSLGDDGVKWDIEDN
jgi:hypothetical protein